MRSKLVKKVEKRVNYMSYGSPPKGPCRLYVALWFQFKICCETPPYTIFTL